MAEQPEKSARTSCLTVPDLGELECLVLWPNGTNGYYAELELVRELLELCKKHGFGRVPQLCAQIEDIWRCPEKIPEFVKHRDQHVKWLLEARKELENGHE